jgi:hypothetical protein
MVGTSTRIYRRYRKPSTVRTRSVCRFGFVQTGFSPRIDPNGLVVCRFSSTPS